jgi:hypothetical protein
MCYPLWGHRSHLIGHLLPPSSAPFRRLSLCEQPLIIRHRPLLRGSLFPRYDLYQLFNCTCGPGFESRDLWSDVETHLLPSLGAHSYDAPIHHPHGPSLRVFAPQLFTRPDRFIGPMAYVTLFYSNLPRLSPLISNRVLGSRLNFLRSPAHSTPQRALSSLLPLSPQSFRQIPSRCIYLLLTCLHNDVFSINLTPHLAIA